MGTAAAAEGSGVVRTAGVELAEGKAREVRVRVRVRLVSAVVGLGLQLSWAKVGEVGEVGEDATMGQTAAEVAEVVMAMDAGAVLVEAGEVWARARVRVQVVFAVEMVVVVGLRVLEAATAVGLAAGAAMAEGASSVRLRAVVVAGMVS